MAVAARRVSGGRFPAMGGLAVRAGPTFPGDGAGWGAVEGESAVRRRESLADSAPDGPTGGGGGLRESGSGTGGDTAEGGSKKSQIAAAAHTASPPVIAQRAKGRRPT